MASAPDTHTPQTDLRFILLALVLAVAGFHLALAFQGREISRDQHLGTAVEYAKGRIDLLHPVIQGANANGAATPLEFPIWQGLTAALMKGFGLWHGWGNVVSLLFHFSVLWPLFQLAQALFSQRVAWWALVFYLAQPLTFLWGGMASADAPAAAFAFWFVYLGWRMMNERGWPCWLAASIVGCLSATTKAPFFMAAGLTLFFWLLRKHSHSRGAWIKLVSAGALSVAAFAVWNHHANECYKAAELPYCDLRVGGDIMQWWFGTLSQRFNLKNWLRAGWRVVTGLLGSFALLALVIPAFFSRFVTPIRLWLLAAFCSTLVFTELILFHWHYYYIVSLPVALLCAYAADKVEPMFWNVLPIPARLRLPVLMLGIAGIVAQGLQTAHLRLYLDPFPQETGNIIKSQTSPTDKIVFWGSAWGVALLRSERQGVTISNWETITDRAKLERLKTLGYNKLVLINLSPLAIAVNTASGVGGFASKDLPRELPPVAQTWPILFQSPDVLIVEIPK